MSQAVVFIAGLVASGGYSRFICLLLVVPLLTRDLNACRPAQPDRYWPVFWHDLGIPSTL